MLKHLKAPQHRRKVHLGLILLALGTFAVFALWPGRTHPDRNYQATFLPAGAFDVNPPALPDISGYTAAAIEAKWPKEEPGTVKIELLEKSTDFRKKPSLETADALFDMQETDEPVWISVEKGVLTLAALTKAVGNPAYLELTDAGYVLKVPLLIKNGATLLVKSKSAPLLLNAPTGAFVISYGRFFALDTLISSWDSDARTAVSYGMEGQFRPYFLFLNGSETYMARSQIRSLGYNSAKAWGLSFSSNPRLRENPSDELAPVVSWLIDNDIQDLYYGYYTYEVGPQMVIGNRFIDNIIYGIDPHDYSSGLIIANNTVSGSKEKHGIILSREVNDSWVFGNTSFQNKGSGIMLDRNCRGNIVADNNLHENGGDGLFFSESPDNLSWGNHLLNNKNSGLRLRNSWGIVSRHDQVIGNAGYGVTVYRANLDASGRDNRTDPYTQKAGIDLAFTDLSDNLRAHLNFEGAEDIRLYRLTILRTPGKKIVTGDLARLETGIYDAFSNPEQGISLKTRTPLPPLPVPEDNTPAAIHEPPSEESRPQTGAIPQVNDSEGAP